MPTINATITVDAEVEFEVFCSCGNGLCGQTETRTSNRRRYPQAVVEPCPNCLQDARESAEEKVRDQMQMRIDDLESELENEKRKHSA